MDQISQNHHRKSESYECVGSLVGLRDWNNEHAEDPVSFNSQVSIDAARDHDLLSLCDAANLRSVFIGIETPNEASLTETGKRQNLKIDLVEQIEEFLNHGIAVVGGIIVGFDSDGPDIFKMQQSFIEKLPIPILTIGSLVAPKQTPLYDRLLAENRLSVDGVDAIAGSPFQTNITPKQMSAVDLTTGVEQLFLSVYSPSAFEQRVFQFANKYKSRNPNNITRLDGNNSPRIFNKVMINLASRNPGLSKMCGNIVYLLKDSPDDTRQKIFGHVIRYAQILHLYDTSKKTDGSEGDKERDNNLPEALFGT